MRRLNYARFNRTLIRAEEIALTVGMVSTVKNVYDEVVKEKAATFRSAHDGIALAESKGKKEGAEAEAAVKALEPLYRMARSALLAVVPTAVVPKTLAVQPTDTDKLYALETLMDRIDDHVGKKWADDLLNGDFGAASAKAVKELTEAIAANAELSTAVGKRAEAYGPAYEALLSFKRVVRSALGSSSKPYRRLHGRSAAGEDSDEENEAEEGSAAPPANDAAGAPAKGPAEGVSAPADASGSDPKPS